MKKVIFAFIMSLLAVGCIPSYKFNGSNIDYTVTKTISFEDFPIKASLVYPPLAIKFNDELQRKYANQTRLTQVDTNGDLHLSGAITGYSLSAQAIKEDALAALTRLTIKVKVKFINRHNKADNFEQEFSAFRDFNSTEMITDVQDGLCDEMIEELTNEIFNATVANW